MVDQDQDAQQQERLDSASVTSQEPEFAKFRGESEELMQTIKSKQEDIIKSLVMHQAIFEQVKHVYDPELGATLKSGAYREELINSIVNKSGVFVKEFREMKDPYQREEFIMSINRKDAHFAKVEDSTIKMKEFEVYQ